MAPQISRRSVLGGTVAAGALAATSAQPAHAGSRYDCLVVGGGLSGLAAARQLTQQGFRALVIEARDRAGGRVQNVRTTSGDYVIDGGAEFVGPTQDRIQALADEYGVDTMPTYNGGSNLYWRTARGRASRYPALLGIPLDLGTPDAAQALVKLELAAALIEPGRPWEALFAGHWDRMTFADWIRHNTLTPSAALQMSLVCSATLSVRPDEISALFMFNYIASAGNEKHAGSTLRLIGVGNGAQERFFDGGAARVPLSMAAELGSRVVYRAPVSTIDTRSGDVVVHTARGTFRGRRAIVAMSPAIAGRISYPGGLTAQRDRLHSLVRMGSIGKFQAVYDAPFWRDRGLSGQVVGDGTPIDVTFESYSQGRHFLMGFISADSMRRLDDADPAAFTEECLAALERYFGPEVRTRLLDHGFKRWDHDPYSWGGPTGVSSPGVLTTSGAALRDPIGPLHWAGTESATYWQGYMDGAVSSGYRAADEVAAALG